MEAIRFDLDFEALGKGEEVGSGILMWNKVDRAGNVKAVLAVLAD